MRTFFVILGILNSDWTKKNYLIENHFKTIYESVRIDRSSYMAYYVAFPTQYETEENLQTGNYKFSTYFSREFAMI